MKWFSASDPKHTGPAILLATFTYIRLRILVVAYTKILHMGDYSTSQDVRIVAPSPKNPNNYSGGGGGNRQKDIHTRAHTDIATVDSTGSVGQVALHHFSVDRPQ